MQIDIDKDHAELVERAVAEGRGSDARGYVQSLIEADTAAVLEQPDGEDREALGALLLERLEEEPRPRPDNWRELIRQKATERLESRA